MPRWSKTPTRPTSTGTCATVSGGHGRPRVEHRPELIGLVVGVEHRDRAALDIEQPFEPGGQHRPDRLGILVLDELGQEFVQQGLAAGIEPGEAGRGGRRLGAIRRGAPASLSPCRMA